MAYINKKDFSIREYVLMNKFIPNDDYFECDDLIAPAIALLNKKGYKTTFCCSGHPYPAITSWLLEDPMMIIALGIGDLLETYRANEIKERLINEFGYTEEGLTNEEVSIDDLYCAIFKVDIYSKLYVSFEDDYDFSNLPDIFYYDKDNKGIYQKPAMMGMPDALETFEGMELVFDTNRIFYNYVKGLKSLI